MSGLPHPLASGHAPDYGEAQFEVELKGCPRRFCTFARPEDVGVEVYTGEGRHVRYIVGAGARASGHSLLDAGLQVGD